jgi:NADP-dependent aldehyde dehydrogenase
MTTSPGLLSVEPSELSSIAGQVNTSVEKRFQMQIASFNPRTGEEVTSASETSSSDVRSICGRAADAAATLRDTSPAERRAWLNALADVLEKDRANLVAIADDETALGAARLEGELTKTIAQTRFYGDVAVEGSYLGLAIDDATDTTPAMVRMCQPIGTVAVFGASNFPFVLGALGHDTAAAIAAGCPVIAKAHRAHLGLSLRLAELARSAMTDAGAPEGVFDGVLGHDAGVELVRAPEVAAVAFTGSESGGLALWTIANERPIPIPVYAEMGTINPIIVTPRGVTAMDDIARGFVATFTSSAGQYCTKPGVLFAPEGSEALERVSAAFRAAAPSPVMLTASIARSVRTGIAEMQEAGATLVEESPYADIGYGAPAAVLEASVRDIAPDSRLLEECFGAVAVVCTYRTVEEVCEALRTLQASLVAAVFTGDAASDSDVAPIVDVLEDKVGRVVFNGWTTGAPHGWAQNHGGPWPATSNASGTSIGAAALDRFVRPVAFQSAADQWLPQAARDGNPWNVTRRVNGILHQGST